MSSGALPAARSASTAWAVTASSLKARMTWPTGLRMPVVLRMSSLVNRALMSGTPGWATASLRQDAAAHGSGPFSAHQPRVKLAHEAAPEGDDADDEDDADDHRHPLADAVGKQVLQADDGERAEHRAGEGAHAAEQRHQHDLARKRP